MPPIPDTCFPNQSVAPVTPLVSAGYHYFAGSLPVGTRFQVRCPGEVRTGKIDKVNPCATYAYMDHEGKVIAISHATPVIVLKEGTPMKEPTPIPRAKSVATEIQEGLEEFSNDRKAGKTVEEMVHRSRQPSLGKQDDDSLVDSPAPDSSNSSPTVYFSQEKEDEASQEPTEDNDSDDSDDGPPPRHLVEVKPVGRKGNPNRYRLRKNKTTYFQDPSGNGLQKTHVSILKALYRGGRPMDRKEIAIEGDTDYYSLPRWIGAIDEEVRTANDGKYGACLLTRGYIREAPVASSNGREQVGYTLTREGKELVKRYFGGE